MEKLFLSVTFHFDCLDYKHPFFFIAQNNSDVLQPNGVQVDKNGIVYVGEYGQGAVYCIDPK